MKIPCTIMRGGTSKGVFLRERSASAGSARDQTLLRIFGSPDRRQIDGLGGADPLTSKVAILGEPSRSDADIDYTFGQIGIETGYVDYGGYCGNILAGVAAYAVEEGFVKAAADNVEVRVNVTNTDRIVYARVPVTMAVSSPKATSRSRACRAPAHRSCSISPRPPARSPGGYCRVAGRSMSSKSKAWAGLRYRWSMSAIRWSLRGCPTLALPLRSGPTNSIRAANLSIALN